MSDFFRDIARRLRNSPGIQFPSNGNPADMRWIVTDTIPREQAKLCIDPLTRHFTTTEFTSPPVNDTTATFTAQGKTYEIRLSVDGGATTTPATDYHRTVELPSAATPTQIALVIAGAINTMLGVRSVYDGEEVGVYHFDSPGTDIPVDGTAKDANAGANYTISNVRYPIGYRPGQPYRRCEWMIIDDVWIEGGDDQNVNLVATLRADMERMSEEFDDIEFPDQNAGDKIAISYPYGGNSKSIDWEFELANPTDYTRAPNGQPHPLYPNALLISERKTSTKGVTRISRHYQAVGPLDEQTRQGYTVDYECHNDDTIPANRWPIVTLLLDVDLATWNPPIPGSACPITGQTATLTNPHLDFSSLVLIKPPHLEAATNVIGKASFEYRRLPSHPRTTSRVLSSPKNQKIYRTEMWVAIPWSPPPEPQVGDSAIFIHADYADHFITSIEKPDPSCLVAKFIFEHAPVPEGAFIEYGSVGFRFPPLYPAPIIGWPPAAAPFAGGRAGWSETTPCKIEMSYTRDPATEMAGGDPVVPADVMPTSIQFFSYLLRGVQDAIENQELTRLEVTESVAPEWWSMQNILHDQVLIEDPKTGSTVVTVTPSDPSAEDYRAGITAGTFFVIKDFLQIWLGDIYVRTKISVKHR